MSKAIVILTTVGSEEQAISIAEALVEKNLSACVNMVPGIRSIYRWKGEVCSDEEYLLIIKTIPQRFDEIHTLLRTLHNYELPECIALPLDQGCREYIKWIQDSSTGNPESDMAAEGEN